MITTEINYRVLYAHTDKMGIVNNARYFEYFEAGRGDMLRNIGYAYKDMEQKNIALPLIEAYCKYIGTAKYDDILVVKCYMNNIPTVKTRIDYEIFVDGKLIATGFTVHSFVDLIKIKPVRPPKDFIELIKTYF